MPFELRRAAALVNTGAALSATELDNLPQIEVERLALLNEVRNVISLGLEV